MKFPQTAPPPPHCPHAEHAFGQQSPKLAHDASQ
jgi:hypothetical protein